MTSTAILGQPPVVPAATVAVQLCLSYTTVAAGSSQATAVAYTCWILMLQLWENRPLRLRLPQVKQGNSP
jgi:hypothetical protein